jgi:signal peptide peptidase SppA
VRQKKSEGKILMTTLPARSGNWLKRLLRRRPVVPVVRLHGVIAADQRPGRLNIAGVEPLLKRAFSIKSAPAVAIVVNSPGGSPVQSRLISKRIRDLADEHKKPVLVFVEDAAASGGYFIAVAGDEIIADPSSIVGSIGVIMATFGFVEAIAKLGVERRLYTAGQNKSTLDPFLPAKDDDVSRIKTFETDIHQVFIDHVKSRRGGKLKGTDDELFTGEWWTGLRGLQLGLVDALGDLNETIATRFGKDIALKIIEPKRGLFQLPRLGFSTGTLASDAAAAIEDRALWARFGL